MKLVVLSHIAIALVATSPAQHNHHVSSRAIVWQVSKKIFGSHARAAFCIASYETGHTFNARSVSTTDDHGEWQIHNGLEKYGRRIYNVWFNAHIAFRMSKGGTDWSQWTTHSLCDV